MLRIASYNIHSCVGADFRQNPGRVADALRALECDTLGLQEVDNQPGERSDSMQLSFLSEALGMQAIAGNTLRRHLGHYGNALLTRRPILASRLHDISFAGHEPRGIIDALIDVDGTAVRILNAHLGLWPAERRAQVRRIVDLLLESPSNQPVVVLGDFNEWLRFGRPLRWMHRAFGEPPFLRTFPVWRPLFALDRLWVRPRSALRALRVMRGPAFDHASDHLPLRAVIDVEAFKGASRVATDS